MGQVMKIEPPCSAKSSGIVVVERLSMWGRKGANFVVNVPQALVAKRSLTASAGSLPSALI